MRCFSKRDGEDRCCRRPESRAGRILHFGCHALLAVAVVAVVSLVIGWVVMFTWNLFMPAVFNLPLITFWQAVALLVLGRLLTGRLHHHRRHHHHKHGCCSWKKRFRQDQDCDTPTPPHGGDYARWWWEEGETAFQAYQARKSAQSDDTGTQA